MDPITITTAAAKIVSTTLQLVQTCNEYYQKYKAVDLQLVCMQTQCSIIEVALLQIQDVIVHDSARFERLRSVSVLASNYERTLGACQIVFAILKERLHKLNSHLYANCGKPDWQVKVRIVWNDQESAILLKNIEGQASAISLLLNAIQMKTQLEMLGLLSKKESKSILKTASADADTFSLAHEKTASLGLSDGESVTTSMLDDKEFEFDSEIINTIAYRKVFNKARSKLPPEKGSRVHSAPHAPASSSASSSVTDGMPSIPSISRPNFSFRDIKSPSVIPKDTTEGAGDSTSSDSTDRIRAEERLGLFRANTPESTSKESEYRTRESSISTTIGTGWRDKVQLARKTDHCHQSAPAGQLLTPQGDDPQSSSNNNSQEAPTSSYIEFTRRKPDVSGTNFPRNGLRSFTVLRGLSHPNIINLYDTFDHCSYLAAILDYALYPGENLAQYVAVHTPLSESSCQKFFAQIISAVGYLHRNGIVNPTLSCSEVLLDSNQNAILTGFSNVKSFDIKYYPKFTGKPILFRGERAEQVCCSAKEASLRFYERREADVLGCGTILVSTMYGFMTSVTDDLEYFMLTNDLAFAKGIANLEGDDAQLLLDHKWGVTLIRKYYSIHVRHLLTRMVAELSTERADLPEIAEHLWLSDFADIMSDIIKNPIARPYYSESPSLDICQSEGFWGLDSTDECRCQGIVMWC